MDADQREHEQAMDEAAGLIRPLGELLDDVVRFRREYIVMSEDQAICLALWDAHTHAIEAADTTPYVHVTAPTMRSGKTRVLEVSESIVAYPLVAANATSAALLRSMDGRTLLYDEVDAVFGPRAGERHEDVRALLNSGYRRGIPALRCEGQGSRQDVVEHVVFCPKMLSGIGTLPNTLADRSLPIRLKRRTRSEEIKRWRQSAPPAEAAMLRNALAAWASENLDVLKAARPDLPEALDDRAQDAFEPLLAIADHAGGDWPEKARRALIALRNEQAEEEEIIVRLLADIRRAFDQHRSDRLSTRTLIDTLCDDEEAPWSAWHRDGGRLSPRALGRLLQGVGIRSRTIRLGNGETAKGYLLEQFTDAWERYPSASGPTTVTSVTTASSSQEQAHSDPSQDPRVTEEIWGGGPDQRSGVTDVTEEAPPPQENPPQPPLFSPDTDEYLALPEPQATSPCRVSGHVAIWKARDHRWRCLHCEPPALPGEVVETNGVVL